jgi:predicted membrane-bound spermidine synthase
MSVTDRTLSRAALLAGVVGTIAAGVATFTAAPSTLPILVTFLAFLLAIALLAVLLVRSPGNDGHGRVDEAPR